MRRFLRAIALAALLLPAPLVAQRVKLEVSASEPGPNGARRPIVRTPGILRDQRWLESLQSSFPLRLQYRVEIWRVRTDWFDALERSFEWEVVVQYEPLTDEYSKAEAWGGALRRQNRFSTLQDLELDLERGNQIGIAPAAIGLPCDPSATTIAQTTACVFANQSMRVEKMVAAEFNDACPLLTAMGLAPTYPNVCSGH